MAPDPDRLIEFHQDVNAKTMQVPLNAAGEYAGGRVVYAAGGALVEPERRPGFALVHDRSIAHGVTPLTAGERFSLFFLRGQAGQCTDQCDVDDPARWVPVL